MKHKLPEHVTVDCVDILPNPLKKYDDINELMRAYDRVLEFAADSYITYYNSQWVLTCNLRDVIEYERTYSIQSSSEESLEFRKQRIMNRMRLASEYTYRYLIKHLNRMLGEDRYVITLTPNDYSMELLVLGADLPTRHEVLITLQEIMPANIVYKVTNDYLMRSVAYGYTGVVSATTKHARYTIKE